MRIGFVHFMGGMGENIRNAAIRDFLRAAGFEVIDILLETGWAKGSLWTHVTMNNLRSLLQIVLQKRTASLLAEITWNEQLRRFQRFIPRWHRQILGLDEQVDVFHAETHLAAYLCALVKRKTKKPFVFDMHGVRADEARMWGDSLPGIHFWEKVEREAVKEADRILVVSRATIGLMMQRYNVPRERFMVVPNGTELYPDQAQYGTPLRVIYGGNFAYYERVQDFVKVAELLQGQGYEFILMGDGWLRNQVLDYINSRHVDIIYLGRKSRAESLRRFCQMQIGVAPSTKDVTRQVASPMKVLDYAACGLPVVTVNVGEWSDMIKRYDSGIVTENSDPSEFAEAIVALRDPKVWAIKSANAREMVRQECLWDKVLEPLDRWYGSFRRE